MSKAENIGYYNVETGEDLPIEIYGIIYLLLNKVNENNIIIYNNFKEISSLEKLRVELNISDRVWRRYSKIIKSNNILIKEINKIYLNPKYNNNYTRDVFDIFEKDIKQNLSYFKYLQIKSNWYEVNHQITINTFDELQNNISGIYRLYNRSEIVYIGKSKNIKGRIKEHFGIKEFDSFDFTILANESDKNLYELYLIDKYKPKYNKDCVEKSTSTIKLNDIIFSKKINFDKKELNSAIKK